MKNKQWREGGQTLAGILVGFNLGMDTYMTFFLAPNTHRNRVALFLASMAFSTGLLLSILSRARKRQETGDCQTLPITTANPD